MSTLPGTARVADTHTGLPYRDRLARLLASLEAGDTSPRQLIGDAEREELLSHCCREALRADPAWLTDQQTVRIFGYLTGKMQAASSRAATRACFTVARALAAPPRPAAAPVAATLRELALQWQASGLLPATGQQTAGNGPGGPDVPLPRRGDELQPGLAGNPDSSSSVAARLDSLIGPDREIGSHARMMVRITGLLLAGTNRRRRPAVQVGVVFGRDEATDAAQEFRLQGATGQVILQELPGGPAGLFPDPVAMAAGEGLGPDFARSVSDAWASAPAMRTDACLLWRIEMADRSPLPPLSGPSLGAAFAVALRAQLQYPASARPSVAGLRGFFHGFRARTALTGEVTVDGRLAPVGELSAKFTAAARMRWRLVVPAGNRNDLHLAPDPGSVWLAANVRDADRLLRRWRTGRIVVAIGAAALVASAIAVPQLVSAESAAQQHARQESALALSTKLANLAVSNLNTHLDIAQLLAVEATRIDNTPQARAALFQAATAAPNVQRFVPVGAPVSALAASASGRLAVAGTSRGTLVAVNPATGARTTVQAGQGSVTAIAVSADGSTIAAVVGPHAVVWQPGSGRAPASFATVGNTGSVAVSPDGQLVAAVPAPSGPALPRLTERDLATGQQRQATVPGMDNSLDFRAAFSSDSTILVTDGTGAYAELSAPGLQVLGRAPQAGLPAGGYTAGASADGAYVGFVFAQQVADWPTTTARLSSGEDQHRYGIGPDGEASSLVLSNDGLWAAMIAGGTIDLSQLSGAATSNLAATELPASSDTSYVSFLGGDDGLISATGTDQLALWNLGGSSQLARSTGISVPGTQFAPGTPSLTVSPDGRRLAMFSGAVRKIFVYRLGTRISRVATYPSPLYLDSMFWHGDQLVLAASTAGLASPIRVTIAATGQQLATVPGAIGGAQVFGTAETNSGRELVLVSARGVRTVSLPAGTSTMHLATFRALTGSSGYGLWLSPAGDSGVTVARNRLVYLDLATGASRVMSGQSPDESGAVAAVSRAMILADQYSDSTGSLEEWNATGTSVIRTVPGVGSGGPIAVSPDGSMMAWVSGQGVVSVVDLGTGTVLATFTLPSSDSSAPEPGDLTAVQFTPDNQYLLTATPGGALGRWDIGENALIKVACTRAAHNLTRAEWQQYVGMTVPADLSCLR